MINKKAVVLLSGGLDSSTLLYFMKNLGYRCNALSIYYGQVHSKEIQAAEQIAKSVNVVFKWINISCLSDLLPSSLTGNSEIPEGHYQEESMKSTVVPNRNMILLAIASGYAQAINASYIGYAAHSGDHVIYPDCRPEFAEQLAKAIKLGTGWNNDGVNLVTPFMNKSKADIVKLGLELKVPYELTWSCYKGQELACGKCGTCIERLEAFNLNNTEDSIKYEK